jgi:hypothetical protein
MGFAEHMDVQRSRPTRHTTRILHFFNTLFNPGGTVDCERYPRAMSPPEQWWIGILRSQKPAKMVSVTLTGYHKPKHLPSNNGQVKQLNYL